MVKGGNEMQIQKAILLDLSADLLLNNVKEIQKQRNLNIDDMEHILEQVLSQVRKEKQNEYANIILDLTMKLQEKEAASQKTKCPQNKNNF